MEINLLEAMYSILSHLRDGAYSHISESTLSISQTWTISLDVKHGVLLASGKVC
jgi:hypothetical protein